MKKISIILFTICALLCSCSKNEVTPVDPVVPVVPATDRKLSFHCAIHNLTYRFSQYTDDKYKALKMPCPACNADSAAAFMKANNLSDIQLLCPIDSTWTTIDYHATDTKVYDFAFKTKRIPFVPIIPTTNNLGAFSITSLTNMLTYNLPTLWVGYPPIIKFDSCWCLACINKALTSAIKYKNDSITTYHNFINGIVGINFTTYPINTGVPPDRRVRATQILDSIEAIMPTLNSDYKKEYNSINQFVGYFNYYRQDYLYCKKTGTPMGSYVTKDIARSKICADEYIGDTVIINIGGGPDYKIDGTGVTIPLYKVKSSTYTMQNVKSLQAGTHKSLVHSGRSKAKSSRSKADAQYQLSTDFMPGNIDFFPSQYLPRKYNTYTTSTFSIFHPQKGNELLAFNGKTYTWNFIDLAKTVGGYDKKFPYNISSVYNAEVLNDVGTMEIRKVVEWCKTRGKHMVLMGSSWGGAMIFDYLLYYPTTDFDLIIIADQNPNMQEAIVGQEMEDYVYNAANVYGTDPNYKEINKNMCVISSDIYRRMNWLKNQDLSNCIFYYGAHDDNVGNIPANNISTLKSQGAKIFKFPDACHGVFHDYRVWYRYWTPVQM